MSVDYILRLFLERGLRWTILDEGGQNHQRKKSVLFSRYFDAFLEYPPLKHGVYHYPPEKQLKYLILIFKKIYEAFKALISFLHSNIFGIVFNFYWYFLSKILQL